MFKVLNKNFIILVCSSKFCFFNFAIHVESVGLPLVPGAGKALEGVKTVDLGALSKRGRVVFEAHGQVEQRRALGNAKFEKLARERLHHTVATDVFESGGHHLNPRGSDIGDADRLGPPNTKF